AGAGARNRAGAGAHGGADAGRGRGQDSALHQPRNAGAQLRARPAFYIWLGAGTRHGRGGLGGGHAVHAGAERGGRAGDAGARQVGHQAQPQGLPARLAAAVAHVSAGRAVEHRLVGAGAGALCGPASGGRGYLAGSAAVGGLFPARRRHSGRQCGGLYSHRRT
nr:hypothetical protein [Tanacetum cinerariifolium]